MDAQFEHLCRICAANTKSKTNSVVESVFIFKTQGLKDKISRHLYLNVAEEDPLPKVLCKSCYRQVEATASLSNIAKHTQLVFRDFLLSTLPKNAREAAAARLSVPATKVPHRYDEVQAEIDEFRPILLTRVPESRNTASKPQPDSCVELAPKTGENYLAASFSSSSLSKPAGSVKNYMNTGRRNSVFTDTRPLSQLHCTPIRGEPSVEEALPEHMIFAAPKKKREDEEQFHQTALPKLKKTVPSQSKTKATTLDLTISVDSHNSPPSTSISNVKSLTDAIFLGSVIRDPDLLMLILKALKWPVTAENCDEQMSRLKSSKFAVIMSDTNLLQDTDLTQLLGPYLAPMLPVVQQQDQPPLSSAIASASSNTSSQATKDVLKLTDLSSAMPYKLPPETSVQLVPSSPTEQEPQPLRHKKTVSVPTFKRHQRKMSALDLPAVDNTRSTMSISTSKAAYVSNELSSINSVLFSQFESNPADAINEALMSLLKQQQQETKDQRKTRQSCIGSDSAVNLEDIVLVDPQPPLEVDPQDVKYLEDDYVSPQSQPGSQYNFKRRKTDNRSSEPSEVIVLDNSGSPNLKNSKEICLSTKQILFRETKKSAVTVRKESLGQLTQAPTSTVPEDICDPKARAINAKENPEVCEPAPDNGASDDIDDSKAGSVSVRKSEVKAALGQKLLEAIGLSQMGTDAAPENSRDTLRSALKRSIKQAQEQQLQLKRGNHEEPVKQMADSTTKLSAAESADEHKKAIAERELALLNRGLKAGEENTIPLKDDKSERTDVSSSSSRNRRGRKLKINANVEDFGDEEKKDFRWDEDDDLPLKADMEKPSERSSSNTRPTRTSKTLSKYYKGPTSKSHHGMGTRSTRQR
ncbi:GD22997 [Drosophila simulans]|uniref:GD22997 n=1 Tax=Drosophila simulans TaxID=7240 RepID=B4Q5L3_DROSI|nr:GD22997 [Drosophila simulans]